MSRKNPYLSPLLHHGEELSPQQRRRVIEIGFWAMFAYLELYILDGAATDLLGGIAAGIAVAFIIRGRHPHFLVLHAGILTSMGVALFRQPSTITGLDFALLLSLSTLFITRGSLAILVAVALEHLAALALDPWSGVSVMRGSPVIAAHVVARVLAIAMAVGIVWLQWLGTREEMAIVPVATDDTARNRRPMTAAEWDEQNRK